VACTDIVRLLGKASNICFSRYEQPAVICRFVRLFAPLTHVRTVMHKHAPWPRHRHRHALHNLKIFKKQFNYIFTHAYTLQQVTPSRTNQPRALLFDVVAGVPLRSTPVREGEDCSLFIRNNSSQNPFVDMTRHDYAF